MTEDWSKWTDEQVFGQVGEQPGSQASYWRDVEIKRRLYVLEKQALEAQLSATTEQRAAIQAQRDAVAEMRRQSTLMLWSVIGVFVTAVVTLAAAFF